MRAVLIPVLLAIAPFTLAQAGAASAEVRPVTGPVRAQPTQALACPASVPMQKVRALPAPWIGGTIGQTLTSASIRKRFGKDVLDCNYNTGYVVETMTPANACAVAPGGMGFVCVQGTPFSSPN